MQTKFTTTNAYTNANTDGVFQDTNISCIKDIIATVYQETWREQNMKMMMFCFVFKLNDVC